jgi:hypothetical protein
MGPGMMGPGMGWYMPSFADFDRDGNGRISPSEFNETRGERRQQRTLQGYPMRGAAHAPTFSDINDNGNGSISQDEFEHYHYAGRRPWMGWR